MDGHKLQAKLFQLEKFIFRSSKKIEEIKNVSFIQCDFLDEKTKQKIINFFGKKLDVIISDMAADTTGNKSLDCIRTNQLCAERN